MNKTTQINLKLSSAVHILSDSKNKKILVGLVLAFFTVWSFPALLYNASYGLDPSWVIAIHMAKIQHLAWGTDLIFTYGPLGYLLYPININHDVWSQTVSYTIISHTLFFLVLFIFVIKTKSAFRNAILFGLLSVILVKLGHEYLPLFGLLLSFYLYLQYSVRKIILIPMVFSAAFLMYTKLDLGTGSLFILIILLGILLIKNRWKEAIACCSIYVGSLILLWVSITNSLINFKDYFMSSLLIVTGYSSALSTNESPIFFLYMAMFAWGLYCWWIYDSIKHRQNLKIILLSSPILFLFFRLGFVRDIGHPMYFLMMWSAIFLTFVSVASGGKRQKFLIFSSISLVIIFALSSVAYWSNLGNGPFEMTKAINNTENAFYKLYSPEYLTSIPDYAQYLVNDQSFTSVRNGEKNQIKNYYGISQNALTIIGNQTVDVIEFDQSIPYAYDLNWHPKPVLQSFNAYNADLDNVDAAFLQKSNSPKFILYKNTSIDGRFALFDEPSTIRAILCNYQVKGTVSDFLLLQRNENICLDEKIISEKTIKFGEEITIPPVQDGYLFAKIYMSPNILGKISDVLYKTPPVYVHINNEENKYRFIYKTAANGILLSGSERLQTTLGLFNDSIENIKFTTDENYYSNEIKIEFLQVHVNETLISSKNKFIIDNPIDMVLQLYNYRPDLQKAFPDAKDGDLKGLLEWTLTDGVKDYQRFYLVKPVLDLLQTYYNRSDLQKAFPEVRDQHNIENLLKWARDYGIREDPKLHSEAGFLSNVTTITNQNNTTP